MKVINQVQLYCAQYHTKNYHVQQAEHVRTYQLFLGQLFLSTAMQFWNLALLSSAFVP